MPITQRMLTRTVSVDELVDTIIWGDAEDGALNGGDRLVALIDNLQNVEDLTITISVQSTRGAVFSANTATVPILGNTRDRIDLIGLVGYAMRLTAVNNGAGPIDVPVSVQVEA